MTGAASFAPEIVWFKAQCSQFASVGCASKPTPACGSASSLGTGILNCGRAAPVTGILAIADDSPRFSVERKTEVKTFIEKKET